MLATPRGLSQFQERLGLFQSSYVSILSDLFANLPPKSILRQASPTPFQSMRFIRHKLIKTNTPRG